MSALSFDFDKVIAVKEVSRSPTSSVWKADISDEWMIGSVPHGGYILSVILSAASAHFAGNRPDPISINAYFLRPTAANVPAILTVTDIKAGRYSIAQIITEQAGIVTQFATVTYGNISEEQGPTRVIDPDRLPPPSECFPGSFGRRAPEAPKDKPHIGQKVEVLRDSQTLSTTKAERRQWIRFTDGRHPDLISLGFFADASGPLLTNFGKEWLGGECWFPTMEINIQFRAKPSTTTPGRWIGQSVNSRFITNGRHEVDVELYDENGDIVALARQMALVVPWERNLKNASNTAARL
ncbi:uncharacterized protein SPPG_04448 [Spizellomyces punctatus DAOM BR117]|uniref:Thioesterase domain-containing protein n=1 Tax=Spizellomyces punctatus (strain DAOM BR117) TaxID=645134 RepID=A0A0L0HF83_SPIPD|nr:uncharacterized protein SPPG_04448 [Spizellomyces punctatus DAOM BR117]KND00106.1 hypothetical protein SPPG_04448 [Spizellomyces punctatus DAOM BR117]|eukprot:XP_016608145.1 hypothetical protein SPPG_04448 [Spizellomyces punctatus DAOM BR117]